MSELEVSRLFDGRLKLRHLTLLTTIAEHGSLLAAARELNVTQPVVTRGLREAENVIGVQLFDRGPRGVAITPFGQIMVDHAYAAMSNLRNAATQIYELRRAGILPIHIGTNLAGSHSLLPGALITLKDAHPDMSISVVEGQDDFLTAQLMRRELDLVVGRFHQDNRSDLLRHIRLYDEPVRLVTRTDHPARTRELEDIRELFEFPWVLPTPDGRLRDEIDQWFERAGLTLPSNVIECSTIPTLREILLETDSIAPLPALVAARDDRLALLHLPLDTVPRTIGISYVANQPLSPSAVLMVDLLRQVGAEIARIHDLD